MSGKYKDPNTGFFRTLIYLAVIAGVGYGGWRAYTYFSMGPQNAVIEGVSVWGGVMSATLIFKKMPSSGDRRDVRFSLRSKALKREISVDWKFIASSDRSVKSKPDQDPPLGERLYFRIGLKDKLRSRFKGDYSDVMLTARLFWAGKQQDKTLGSLSHVYEKR